jgi:AcrR family transcriptional regulator
MDPSHPDTRSRLLDAAYGLFALQGFAATGLAQIARAAGVLPGSLYYFFPSKEDLLCATLELRKSRLWLELLEPIWAQTDDPIERVFGLLRAYRSLLARSDFRHGCPIGSLVVEVGESHPRSRALLVENFDVWLDAVEGCFVGARARLPRETDPRRLAVFVLTTMQGAVLLARAYRDFEAFDAACVQLRDHVERLLARGDMTDGRDA